LYRLTIGVLITALAISIFKYYNAKIENKKLKELLVQPLIE